MKNLIILKPVMGEFSEVRGLQDLLTLLKTRTPMARIDLLQRLNLDDIETADELLSIIDVLTTREEREQFYALLDTPFLKRILPLSSDWTSHYPVSFDRICQIITPDSLVCLYPIIEQFTLQQIRSFLDALSTDSLKKMVISVLSNLLIKRLNESLTWIRVKKPDESLSFAKWPTDYYYKSTSWCDPDEDEHADRCHIIIRLIEDALYIGNWLEGTEQTIYFETLFSLLERIIHNPNDFNYLLSTISESYQHLLMPLIKKHGVTPQQIRVLSQNECVFSKWRQCTFFEGNSTKNQGALEAKIESFEYSRFSDEQVSKIQHQIIILQKEIKSGWPFPNKDRKMEKIIGLRALLIKSTQMDACIAIEQIEEEYPEIRKGSISTRTAQLLDGLKGGTIFNALD